MISTEVSSRIPTVRTARVSIRPCPNYSVASDPVATAFLDAHLTGVLCSEHSASVEYHCHCAFRIRRVELAASKASSIVFIENQSARSLRNDLHHREEL